MTCHRAHLHPVPPTGLPECRAACDLPGLSPQSPARARAFTRNTLTGWGLANVETALLIVTELTGNAVTHGGDGPITVTLTGRQPLLTIAVSDRGRPVPPSLRAGSPGLDAESGRGLAMVEALADLWSWRHDGPRAMTVWAALPLTLTSPHPDTMRTP